MIRIGDRVTLSPICRKRHWYGAVKHLEGKSFKVVSVEGEYVAFLCKDGRGSLNNKSVRCWHKSNLVVCPLILENE